MLPRVQRNERIRDDESEHAGDAAGEALHAIAVPLGIIRGHEDGNDVNDVNDVNDDVNDDRASKEIRIFFLWTFSRQNSKKEKVSELCSSLWTREDVNDVNGR